MTYQPHPIGWRRAQSRRLLPQRSVRTIFALLAFLLGFSSLSNTAEARPLGFRDSPADNPLRGLVPYNSSSGRNNFPHSLEFRYFSLADVLKGQSGSNFRFDWSKVDGFLETARKRGNQGIFRIYLEYQTRTGSIPGFLNNKLRRWPNNDKRFSPDYNDRRLRDAMKATIRDMARKYDRDNRVAFIEVGFLGNFGEWHNFPETARFMAPKNVQDEILGAYAQYFKTRKCLVRYPRKADANTAGTDTRPVGFHDDSFVRATLADKSWHFLGLMNRAGSRATNKWKDFPIGGEVYPQISGDVFVKAKPTFQECAEASHTTYMRIESMFSKRPAASRRDQAFREMRTMGYVYHASDVTLGRTSNGFSVDVRIRNRGVAPFYYDWPVELAVFDRNTKRIGGVISAGNFKTRGIQPNQTRTWRQSFGRSGIPSGAKIGIRVRNPMNGGKAFHFANTDQQRSGERWLILGTLNGSGSSGGNPGSGSLSPDALNGKTITIQSDVLRGGFRPFVSNNAGRRDLTCDRRDAFNQEEFKVVRVDSQTIALKGSDNRYLNSGYARRPSRTSSTVIREWEKFKLVQHGNGVVSFKQFNRDRGTDLHLSANFGRAMACDRPRIGAWEKFRISVK